MSINPLSANITNLISPNTAISLDTGLGLGIGGNLGGQSDVAFSNVLSDSLRAAGAFDAQDRASGLELLLGQADDLSGLLLDAQKAELSLNLALQIRNRVLDAYNEVMRMQV